MAGPLMAAQTPQHASEQQTFWRLCPKQERCVTMNISSSAAARLSGKGSNVIGSPTYAAVLY